MAPRWDISDAEILAQIPAARARARHAMRTEPFGAAVRFASRSRHLVLTLTNGVELRIPVDLIPELRGASAAELADVALSPAGLAVHWARLDADLGVPSLAVLALGPRVAARAGGAVAGSRTSPAKAAAARRNGREGGRPKGSGRSAG